MSVEAWLWHLVSDPIVANPWSQAVVTLLFGGSATVLVGGGWFVWRWRREADVDDMAAQRVMAAAKDAPDWNEGTTETRLERPLYEAPARKVVHEEDTAVISEDASPTTAMVRAPCKTCGGEGFISMSLDKALVESGWTHLGRTGDGGEVYWKPITSEAHG